MCDMGMRLDTCHLHFMYVCVACIHIYSGIDCANFVVGLASKFTYNQAFNFLDSKLIQNLNHINENICFLRY